MSSLCCFWVGAKLNSHWSQCYGRRWGNSMFLLWRSWWLHFSTGCLLWSGGVAGVTPVKVLREYCRWQGREIGAGCCHMLSSLMSVNAVTECRLSKGSLWLVGSHMWAGCQHAVQAAIPFSVTASVRPLHFTEPFSWSSHTLKNKLQCLRTPQKVLPLNGQRDIMTWAQSYGKSAVQFQRRCLCTYSWVLLSFFPSLLQH